MKKIHIQKMKQVGIVRQIDSLGRVSVPMEFRKTMNIEPNELLEQKLCKDENNEYVLVIRKYKEN